MITGSDVIRQLLAEGTAVKVRVTGDSMHPTMRDGDLVVVKPVDPGTLRRGDVVLANEPRGLTMHRVVRIARETLTMRGDNARDAEVVALRDVLGKAVRVEGSGAPFDPSSRLRVYWSWVRVRIREFRIQNSEF